MAETFGITSEGIDQESVTAFLDELFEYIEQTGIDVSGMYADHISYKVKTPERYAEVKEIMQRLGTQLSENEVNGREICAFQLHEPILYRGRKISVLELPHPKPDQAFPERFDHVEFVVNEETREALLALITAHSNLAWDRGAMGLVVQGVPNPEVTLHFPSKSDCDMLIRFHTKALADLIKIQQEHEPSAWDLAQRAKNSDGH